LANLEQEAKQENPFGVFGSHNSQETVKEAGEPKPEPSFLEDADVLSVNLEM